jgi:hypothetical protein
MEISFFTNERIKSISKILIDKGIDLKNSLEGPKRTEKTFWNDISFKLFDKYLYENMFSLWRWWERNTHEFKAKIINCVETLKAQSNKEGNFSIDIKKDEWSNAKKDFLIGAKRYGFGVDFVWKFLINKLNKINNFCVPKNNYNHFNKDGTIWKGKYLCENHKNCNRTFYFNLDENCLKNGFYELKVLMENQASCKESFHRPLRITGEQRKLLYLDLEANGTYNVINKLIFTKSEQIPPLQTFKNILFENRHKERISSSVILDAIGSYLQDETESFTQNIGLNPFGALFISKYQVIISKQNSLLEPISVLFFNSHTSFTHILWYLHLIWKNIICLIKSSIQESSCSQKHFILISTLLEY